MIAANAKGLCRDTTLQDGHIESQDGSMLSDASRALSHMLDLSKHAKVEAFRRSFAGAPALKGLDPSVIVSANEERAPSPEAMGLQELGQPPSDFVGPWILAHKKHCTACPFTFLQLPLVPIPHQILTELC